MVDRLFLGTRVVPHFGAPFDLHAVEPEVWKHLAPGRRLDVFTVAVQSIGDDIQALGLGCDHAELRDGRARGRAAVKHMVDECSFLLDSWEALQSRQARWRAYRLALATRVVGTIRTAADHPNPPTLAEVAPFIEQARRGVAIGRYYHFTGYGLDVTDVAERVVDARRPMAAFVGARGFRSVQILGEPTVKLREAIATYLKGDRADALRAEAERLGGLILFGHDGGPVPQSKPDLGEELAALRQRVADLEARPVVVSR